ncbi:MAG: hypothetical protein J1D77_03630 [Muribaculaceae bacterium]|nr:hypothetical protein [Muribaculaceae bacterium]
MAKKKKEVTPGNVIQIVKGMLDGYPSATKGSCMVKRLYFTADDNGFCDMVPEKSDFADIAELRGCLEKMLSGEEASSLAITIEMAGACKVFMMTGLFMQGTNYRILGTVATGVESYAEANILIKSGSFGYYEYTSLAQTALSTLKTKLDNYPEITQAMKTSGAGYVFCEGRLDEVFPANSTPLYEPAASAASLALESIRQGRIILPDDIDDEERVNLIEGIREAIDDDQIFNELAVNAAKTLEITPEISIEEMIRQAKKEYIQAKEEEARLLEESSSDVEPINKKKA